MRGDSAKRRFFISCLEGISQGCSLSIILYGLLLLLFILKLKEQFPTLFASWFANNGLAGGNLLLLCTSFDVVCELGSLFGYYPEMEKCILIVIPSSIANAESLNTLYSHSFNIHLVSYFLGSFIRTPEITDTWVDKKISSWIEAIDNL